MFEIKTNNKIGRPLCPREPPRAAEANFEKKSETWRQRGNTMNMADTIALILKDSTGEVWTTTHTHQERWNCHLKFEKDFDFRIGNALVIVNYNPTRREWVVLLKKS